MVGNLAAFGAGRYVVTRRLGGGGSADVFEARDSALDRLVAVKLLKPEVLDDEGLRRFFAESRTIAGLTHPNITAVYDVGSEEGRHFVVLELVGGGDLRHRIDRAPGRRLPVPEILRIASEVCRALDHAHQAGVLHRDIKPENLMLARSGEVKLTDFGLATRAPTARSEPGTIVGTVAYISPEAARGRLVDPRSDLYSLGAVMYEMATGRTPFRGTDVQLLSAHLSDEPVAPRSINPEIPQPVERIILALLEKEPDKRPSSAAALLQTLADAEMATRLGAPPAEPARPPAQPAHALLVDRGTELARLDRALGELKRGTGGVIVLLGEAGIGKTRLIQEVSARAKDSGVMPVIGYCTEGEGSRPLGPWIQVLRGIASSIPLESVFASTGENASILAPLVPEIRATYVNLLPATSTTSAPERYEVFEAVSAYLLRYARAKPLVICLEDAHWADEATLKLFEYCNRSALGAPVLFLATYRPEELGSGSPLPATLYEVNRTRRLERLPLARLTVGEVNELVAGTLGVERVDPGLLSSVSDRSAGNPFYVKELVLTLSESNAIEVADQAASWRGGPVQLPDSIRHLLERRLGRLAPETQEFLRMASVLGQRFDLELLAGIAHESLGRALERLEEATAASLLTEEKRGTRVEIAFADSRVREFLYASASAHRLQQLHREAAKLCEARENPSSEELAYHFSRGGLAAPASKYLELAGDEALALSSGDAPSFARAITRYEEARGFVPAGEKETQRRLLVKLGRAYWESGRSAAAHQAFLSARERAERPEDQVTIAILLAATLQTMEDLPAARAHLEPSLQLLGGMRTTEAAEALSVLAVIQLAEGDAAGSVRAAERSLAIAETLGNRRQVFDALSNLLHSSLATYQWAACRRWAAQELRIAEGGSTPFAQAWASLDRAVFSTRVEPDYPLALESSARAVGLLRRIQNPLGEARGRAVRAQTLRDMGRWAEADQEIRAGLTLAAEAGSGYMSAYLSLLASQVAGLRGSLAEAEQLIARPLSYVDANAQYSSDFGAQLQYTQAWLHLEAGEAEKARAAARAAFGSGASHRCGLCTDMGAVVLAAVESWDENGGQKWFDAALDHVDRRGTLAAQALAAVPRSAWARLHGRATLDGLSAGEEYLRRVGRKFDLASALHERGLVHRSLGNPREADERVEEALQLYLELGAKHRVEGVLASKRLIRA